MKDRNTPTRRLRYDIILVASLLALCIALLIAMLVFRRGGDYVEVEIDGVPRDKYSLAINGEYNIGEGNTLVIENGEAYMSYADCPDRVCVKRGRVRYVGQSIICLPNKVTVTVRGQASSSGVDLVS